DVRNPPEEALRGVDAVVHLAAISNDPMGSRFEKVTLDINHRATVSLATRAREAGATAFVFCSSCSVYGPASDGRPRTEDSEVAPGRPRGPRGPRGPGAGGSWPRAPCERWPAGRSASRPFASRPPAG